MNREEALWLLVGELIAHLYFLLKGGSPEHARGMIAEANALLRELGLEEQPEPQEIP